MAVSHFFGVNTAFPIFPVFAMPMPYGGSVTTRSMLLLGSRTSVSKQSPRISLLIVTPPSCHGGHCRLCVRLHRSIVSSQQLQSYRSYFLRDQQAGYESVRSPYFFQGPYYSSRSRLLSRQALR